MRRLLRSISCAMLLCLPPAAGLTAAAQAPECQAAAIARLQASAPEGFAIYQKIRDKAFFLSWISCDERELGLPTAVHESVHYLTAETDAFPLAGGGQLKRPHEVSAFFAPSLIAEKFRPGEFVTTYLRPGRASSSGDFLYLLDELNAYTHDLAAAVALHRAQADEAGEYQVDHRDGLAALMAFVAVYVERAAESEPATWSGLREPRVARTVSELWGRAEKTMATSCGIPNFGGEDRALIRQFCAAKPQAALRQVLGRPPVCPTACLTPVPVAERDRSLTDTMPTGSVRASPAANPVRSFWRAISRPAPSGGEYEAGADVQ